MTNAAEDVAIVTLAPETMLPWVCWACGTEEIPSHLVHALDPQLRHVLEHCGLKVEEKARPPGARFPCLLCQESVQGTR